MANKSDCRNIVWKEFGIFPEGFAQRSDYKIALGKAEQKIPQLPINDLKIICKKLDLTPDDNNNKKSLAKSITGHLSAETILNLVEFERMRQSSIKRIFCSNFAKNDFEQRASKPLTQLILLHNKSVETLSDIFYLATWLSQDTIFRFTVNDVDENKLISMLTDNIDVIEKSLGKSLDRGAEKLGCRKIENHAFVGVCLRHYKPKVARDWNNGHSLIHSVGNIVFGFSLGSKTIQLKCANSDIARVFMGFLNEDLGLNFVQQRDVVAKPSDPNRLVDLMKGEIDKEKFPFILSGISFKRNSISGVPLVLGRSINSARTIDVLKELNEKEIVSADSPIALSALELEFQNEVVEVQVSSMTDGSLEFNYLNNGLDDDFQMNFEERFKDYFTFPLNQKIDPTNWKLGLGNVIANIFNCEELSNLEQYQLSTYKQVLQLGLIAEVKEDRYFCKNKKCQETKQYKVPTGDKCPNCNTLLEKREVTLINTDDQAIRKWCAEFFKQTDCVIGPKTKSFEKIEYHPIMMSSSHSGGIEFAGFFQSSLRRNKLEIFDRSTVPVVKFSKQMLYPPCRIERDHSMTISIPALIGSSINSRTDSSLISQLNSAFCELNSAYESLMTKAALVSADRLEHPPSEEDPTNYGKKYEIDVFNVLRWVFWHVARLGDVGKELPDGVISFQNQENSDSSKFLDRFNIGYDAKYSESKDGYEISKSEKRKACSYIKKYFSESSKSKSRNDRIVGHMIISNNIKTSQIEGLVNELISEELISTKESPAIALLRDEFLVRLYREMSQNLEEFRAKRLLLHQSMILAFNIKTNKNFIELTAQTADEILNKVRNHRALESKITIENAKCENSLEIASSYLMPSNQDRSKNMKESRVK